MLRKLVSVAMFHKLACQYSCLRHESKRTLLDDNVVKPQLHLGTFNDAFLHRVLCYEPEHSDLLHLTNPVSPVLRRQPITTHLQPSVNRAQTVMAGGLVAM